MIFIISAVIVSSCTIYGLKNDYETLDETQKEDIVPFSEKTGQELGKIYTLNGKQLTAELEKHPKSLVYVFKNGCTSDLCKPMAVYEDYAKAHNLKLFLVMNSFCHLTETTEQPLENPLFAIDSDFYGVKYRFKYQKYFQNELQNQPIKTKEKEYQGNLYFFTGNKLDKIERELPETTSPDFQF